MEDEHTQAFFDLRAAIKAESYAKALSISTELSKALPSDEDVIKCRCVCMIHLGHYSEALQVASKAGGDLAFEGAYCLYQMNRLSDCLAAIRKSNDAANSSNMKALEAQALYKLNRPSEAANVYQALVDDVEGSHEESFEGSELLSNTLAAYAAAGRGKEGYGILESQVAEYLEEDDIGGSGDQDDDDDDDEDKSYEIAYNAACTLLDAGRYTEAAQLLRVAEARCKQQEAYLSTSSSGGGAEASLTEEGAMITCQRAVAALKATGGGGAGSAEAMALCAGVMKHGKNQLQQQQSGGGGTLGDLAVPMALATNTLAVARKDRELFDSHKRLRAASGEGVEEKLTSEQAYALRMNKCLLLLHMGKLDECEAAAEAMLAAAPSKPKAPPPPPWAAGPSLGRVGPSLVLLSATLKRQAPSLRDVPKALVSQVLSACGDLASQAGRAGFPRAAAEAELFGCQLLLLQGDVKGACAQLEACRSPLLVSAPRKDEEDEGGAAAAAGGAAAAAAAGGGGGEEFPPCCAPAVAATVADMKERFLGDHSGGLKTLDAALSANSTDTALVLAVAKRKVSLGAHQEGARLLEALLSRNGSGGGKGGSDRVLEAEERMACVAHLVLAYSWCDPDKAEELLASGALPPPKALQRAASSVGGVAGGGGGGRDEDEDKEEEDEGSLDPLVLEEAPLPKSASSKVRRLMVVDKKQAKKLAAAAAAAAAAEAADAPEGDQGPAAAGAAAAVSPKKREHEKRAKKHVAKLVAAGKLDPRRPTQPDPLRWVPKKLRTGKGRKGLGSKANAKISGAQGVSTEGSKDAAKLDAYARAQAKKEAELAKAAAEEAGHGAAKRGPWRRMK